ncbi:MAG: EAL domain-containing protein [Chitinispirillales bacterium]|jgi:EAL domain-containing protein (putative c-di-GMP-specific phosphodiesterase class I)/GGDEF domain-containing protein|nr:EAL domain-containing protein [Chitinispirillales bacterium]
MVVDLEMTEVLDLDGFEDDYSISTALTELWVVERILEEKCIKPVYQPVVSLADGEIYGYEALTRITDPKYDMGIMQMFKAAEKMEKSWELETLCREKALQKSAGMEPGKKLFLNVNPNIMHDEKLREGFTMDCLRKYGLMAPDSVIIEITESSAINDSEAFYGAISHYKNQNFKIAIDDVGAGFSGLNKIANLKPNIIKIDMNLIRNIDKDEIKQLLCKAMVDFGENAGIKLVAEGIENEEELKTLIKLKVGYGQGYFLCVPRDSFEKIPAQKIEMIKEFNAKRYSENVRSSIYPMIGNLSKPGHIFPLDECVESVYEVLKHDPAITGFAVVSEEGTVQGFMTKTALSEVLGGRYGFMLHSKRTVKEIMSADFLRVNFCMTVDQVSRFAMQRPPEQLYDPMVVEKGDRYWGIATIKDVLDAYTKVEMEIAMHSNPLTKLPGNLIIEREIRKRILGEDPYCIIYIDLDNFKAYNDAYGFDNGDLMLMLVTDILKECVLDGEFLGHIGGDDFIVICDYVDGEFFCGSIIDKFAARVVSLYRDEDLKNGCITSINRHGVTERFPIASLSIAGISNRVKVYKDNYDFSSDIARLKKKCKKQPGNYFEIL